MNKLHVTVESERLEDDVMFISVCHEPTDTIVSGSCYTDDVEEFGKELYLELAEQVSHCKNWLH